MIYADNTFEIPRHLADVIRSNQVALQRRVPKALANMTAENNPNIMRLISIETTLSLTTRHKKKVAVLYRR